MADVSVGVPITFQIIRRLWPDHVNECMDYLVNNISKDALLMAGITRGGQQFVDFSRKPDGPGVPTGLGIFLLEGADAGHDTRRLQLWLGHSDIKHTARYSELSTKPFKEFWK